MPTTSTHRLVLAAGLCLLLVSAAAVPALAAATAEYPAASDAVRPLPLPTAIRSYTSPPVRPTVAIPSTFPTGIPTGFPTGFPQVEAKVTVTAVSEASAEAALTEAVKALKGSKARVNSAAGYTGSANIPLPEALQSSLGSALATSGTGYFGMYNGFNEAVTIGAGGGLGSGNLALLVEPKVAMPVDAEDALSQLKVLFPGVSAELMLVQDSQAACVFYAAQPGANSYSLGFVSYEGLILAYAMSGSGTYQSLVPEGWGG